MRRLARCLTAMVYSYSLLLGVIAFTYDIDTGQVEKRTVLTIYCCLMNILTLSCVVHFAQNLEINLDSSGQPVLHHKILVVLTIIRIIGVLLTLASNWMRRRDFIYNLNAFRDFRERYLRTHRIPPKHSEYVNRQVCMKFCIGGLCEVIMFYGTVQIMRQRFEIHNPVVLTVLGLMSTVLNLMAGHYFFIAMNIQFLFRIMNDELADHLGTMEALFHLHNTSRIGQGLLSIRCCQLSDQIDELRRNHMELQLLCERINRMFYLQGSCVFLILYLNNICVFYIVYMWIQQVDLGPEFSQSILIFLPIASLLYYADGAILIHHILRYIALVDMPGQMIRESKAWLPILDKRLEESVLMFSLKMAAFPVSRDLIHLFDVTRPMVFASIASTLSNAIVLMQYDYKYNKK
ncbi:putative gustatory receptor 36c [Musca vetustissima]|uniref:putative gustatory receptor 36c n=1 Tax=Musca vetustissima TaxID=27455 RepID=UPI002AB7DC5C|nr:putative gustatory receptor 36c [Musca vetustissima]